jgi:ABC-type multidrug transport system permease subunit
MSTNIRAMLGIAESDLRQQFKSGTFISNIVLSVLFTLLLGAALGSASNLHNLPVNVYDPGQRIHFHSTGLVTISHIRSASASEDQVKTGQAVAAVNVSSSGFKILLDDTNGPDVNGDVSKELSDQIKASLIPQTGASTIKLQTLFGMDTQSSFYGMRLVAAQLMPVAVFLFALVLMGEGLILEKQNHTLFELAMAPVRPVWIILGKMLGGALTLVSVLVAVFLVTQYVFGVHANGNLLLLFLSCFVMGLGLLGFSYIMGSVFPSVEIYRGVMSLVLVLPALFISGVFTPVRSLPDAVQSIAHIIPLSWCVDIVRDVMFKHGTFAQATPDLLLLGAFLIVTLALGPLAVGRLLVTSRR